MKKKVLLMMACVAAMLAAGTGLKAQEVTITLMPGWTWISVPSTETMDFATALGSFTPAVGDRIKSQWGNATYRGNGEWRGQISEFYPGYGYMYYSTRQVPVTVTFNAQQPTQQVVVTTDTPQFITAISAMGGGEVTTTDGTYIIVKGLCWATHENPTTNDDFYEEAESGVGTFSVSMTGLNIATTYYARAYAVTTNGTVYGNQKSFTTRDGIPTVTTDEVTNILTRKATIGGTVTDNGGLNVTERGVCWSTEHNPTLSDSHSSAGSGLGSFTHTIESLNVSTTYYVRAYASTNHGTGYGEELYFTTLSGVPEVVTNPITDIYGDGATLGCTVVNDGGLDGSYDDEGWPEEYTIGVCWSTSPNPTINDYHDFVFNGFGESCDFVFNHYSDFSVYRTGLALSTTYFVRAYAHSSYGTNYGDEISFTTPAPLWSNGVLPGTFSVSANQQVHFSQGNLQYKASTDTWRFGMNQWAYVGGRHILGVYGGGDCADTYDSICGNVFSENGVKCDNTAIASDYSGWIDLFGWGTSGNNHGAVWYQPWSISEYGPHYHAYGQATYNLYDQTGQADWGSNAISNGGNQANQWHTLTSDEWKYVFNSRTTTSGIRYAKAVIFGVSGVILLPDDWNASYYSLNQTNTSDASFDSNIITASQWSVLEQHGAVFLPKAGLRRRYTYPVSLFLDEYYEEEEYGFDLGMFYWSSSCKNNYSSWHLSASDSRVNPQNNSSRHNGMAVRLVCSASLCECPTVTTTEVANITHCQATCGGIVTDDGGYEATVRGVCWSTTPNPTVADAHTVDGNGIGSFNSTLIGLMPSTTYYVRAYATNLLYTAYGNEESFTTFESPIYTISVSANSTDGGVVNGGGTYTYGQSCSIQALPSTGYCFANWTENGNVVSNNSNYTFSVTDSRNIVANFTASTTGVIFGLFSVSESQQVYFSQGNLQYIGNANTPYWKFAEHQWDVLGTTTGQNSNSENVDRDLFGWGTSGYNHGAVCYQPWSTNPGNSNYYAYGSATYNLYDQTRQADWGFNAISNGGNQENQWRTLAQPEWDYLFDKRITPSGIRYAKAQVNGVNGVILLPDNWSTNTYSLSHTNNGEVSFSKNLITAIQWTTLESAGAVFLPASGDRPFGNSTVMSVGSYGNYWSASCSDNYNYAYFVIFSGSSLGTKGVSSNGRCPGYSVRLVRVFE